MKHGWLTSETKELHDVLHTSFAKAATLCGSLSESLSVSITIILTNLLEYYDLVCYNCDFELFQRRDLFTYSRPFDYLV